MAFLNSETHIIVAIEVIIPLENVRAFKLLITKDFWVRKTEAAPQYCYKKLPSLRIRDSQPVGAIHELPLQYF